MAAGPASASISPGAAAGAAAPTVLASFAALAGGLFLLLGDVNAAIGAPIDDARAAQARGDYVTAERLYRSLAGQGNSEAQYNLGLMYRAGRGVSRDYSEALDWFRRAASLGSSSAQYMVADMYLRGLGVDQDLLEAARWYSRAAEQGHAKAQYVLGIMYKLGGGIRKSYPRAARWFQRAADQGVAEAQHELAMLSYSGLGVERDYVAAFKWETLALAAGLSSNSRSDAIDLMGKLQSRMNAAQVAQAQDQARGWQPVSEGNAGS